MASRTSRTPRKNKDVNRLISKDDFERNTIYFRDDRENVVGRMDRAARDAAVSFIRDRMDTAKDQTTKIREKMDGIDKQCKGIWQNPEANTDEDIFLPKTREEVNAVKAFLISILAQIMPIVRMQPFGTNVVWGIEEDYKRAKLNEAMFMYYWNDIWKALDDVMPRWLMHFLKYPMGVFKVSYYETDGLPDLRLGVVDRAFLYLDPRAQLFSDQGWIIEEYYIPKSEAIERIEREDWVISDEEFSQLDSLSTEQVQESYLNRFFGEHNSVMNTISEDEMVQCFDYWQFPMKGLDHVFATVINGSGGEVNGALVRYGRNPFPFKGNPFVAKSYNPDDRPDGQGLAELQEPFQKVTNTMVNLRFADVRKNVRNSVAMLPQLVDKQTIEDYSNGNTIVRIAEEFAEKVMLDPSMDLRKYMAPFGTGTSTTELLTHDLPFILSQGQESSNTPDVFKGQNAQPGATLGQIQEQLSRASGQFTPVIRQMMRAIEQVAEITTSYFRSPEFYPSERMIKVVGKQKYVKDIDDWFITDENTAYKSVTADEMTADLTFDAISGADFIASKTLLMTSIERLMQAVGQIPELFDTLKKEVDFPALFKQLINVTGHDIEGLMLTDAQKEQRAQEEAALLQQQQQQEKQNQIDQIQTQKALAEIMANIDRMTENQKQAAMANKQIMVDMSRISNQAHADEDRLSLEGDLSMEQMTTDIQLQGKTDAELAELQTKLDIIKMEREAELERTALAQGDSISVGRDSDDVGTPGTSGAKTGE